MHLLSSALQEQQADWAFDKLDDLLEKATWRRGVVTLKHGKSAVYCYDVDMLARELATLAEHYVQLKYKQTVINIEDVVDNILDEFSDEITQYQIYRRQRARYKKAQ